MRVLEWFLECGFGNQRSKSKFSIFRVHGGSSKVFFVFYFKLALKVFRFEIVSFRMGKLWSECIFVESQVQI